MNRFILMAVAFIAIAGPASAGINDGLIGHWPFDGDATDATGNGHNGAVSGAALTADRDGNPNSAYQFASGNHIVVPHDAQLNLAGNATIALWMNQQNTYWGAAAVALTKGRDVTAGTYIIWRVPGFSATDIIFTTRPTNPADGVNPIAPLVYDEWHHITAIIDGDNQTQRIYLDGVLASSEVAAYYPWAANNTSPWSSAGIIPVPMVDAVHSIPFLANSTISASMIALYPIVRSPNWLARAAVTRLPMPPAPWPA